MKLARRVAREIVARLSRWQRSGWRQESRGIAILGFHKVRDATDRLPLTIPPSIFRNVIQEIGTHHEFVSLEEVAEKPDVYFEGKLKFALTFDDGYFDNYEIAWPILRAIGVPSTIFLSIDHIEGRAIFWYERLESLLFSTSKPDLSAYLEPRFGKRLASAGPAAVYAFLNNELKDLSSGERESLLRELATLRNANAEAMKSRMLDWSVVREMHAGGVCFGSHTMSHPILANENIDKISYELGESKRRIETELGASVGLFAYPNGRKVDYDERVMKCLTSAGYNAAVTTIPGINRTGQDMYQLRRINLHAEAVAGFTALSRPVLWNAIRRW